MCTGSDAGIRTGTRGAVSLTGFSVGRQEQAAGLGAVTQRVRTPGENGVACQQVHVPDGKAAVGHRTVGKLIEVDLLVQVLTRASTLTAPSAPSGQKR